MKKCHDCGVKEGELHLEGCDMEHCSKCGKQTLMWGNCKNAKPEPYFDTTLSCARCGISNPEFNMVSNELWKYICGVTYNKEDILCPSCMNFIIKKRGVKNA